MPTSPIRLLIVDDHNLFRQGLIRILGDYEQLQIVGQAANGQDALALVEQLQPDVVLMDVNMPVLSGPDAVRQMRARFPGLPVVMLTVSERDDDLFDAIRAGAQGYLLKNVGAAELLDAIQRVRDGEAILAPSMAVRLLDEFRTLAEQAPREPQQAQVGRAERARAGRAAAGGPGAEQSGDRRRVGPVRAYRQDPPGQHPGQAAPAQPRPRRRLRRAGWGRA